MLLIAFSSEGVVQLSFMTTSCSPPCPQNGENEVDVLRSHDVISDTLTASSKPPLGGRNVTCFKYCTRGYKFKISSLYYLLCPFLPKFTVHWFKFFHFNNWTPAERRLYIRSPQNYIVTCGEESMCVRNCNCIQMASAIVPPTLVRYLITFVIIFLNRKKTVRECKKAATVIHKGHNSFTCNGAALPSTADGGGRYRFAG